MIFWWLTLFTSVRPLCNMLTRLVFSVAFVSVTRQDATAVELNGNVTGAGNAGPVEGEFHYKSAVNFDPYLKELGVPYLLRTMAGLATPIVTISSDCPEETEAQENEGRQVREERRVGARRSFTRT